MEIRIHTQQGSVEAFYQDNPTQVARLLRVIHPAKVFAGEMITIAGDYSLTTFSVSRVNLIDFIAEELPAWKYPADILNVTELSEDEYRDRSHLNDPAQLEWRRSPKHTGQFAVVFVEVEMAGGKQLFLQAEIKVALEAERLQRLHMLFSAPGLHFRLRNGGVSILNLKNIVRFTFNPGPDRTPIDAWPAHHLAPRVQPEVHSLEDYGGGSQRP